MVACVVKFYVPIFISFLLIFLLCFLLGSVCFLYYVCYVVSFGSHVGRFNFCVLLVGHC